MSTVPSYFKDFLSNIRLTDNQVNDLKTGHTTLRKRLEEDETLSKIIVSTFLQGSYRRSTAVKPKNGNKSDVDVIVVAKLDSEEYTPEEALNLFVPFLDKHYKNKYRIQGRSIGISLSYVDLDIVPTSAPSESETGILQDKAIVSEYTIEDIQQNLLTKSFDNALFESVYNIFCKSDSEPQWKSEPLLIPDREAEEWDETHPLEQIRWTVEKNKNCNTHYINVVKALKWWRNTQYPDMKHPKSYPLEHFIGDCCPDGITSVAEGIVLTLENIVSQYLQNRSWLIEAFLNMMFLQELQMTNTLIFMIQFVMLLKLLVKLLIVKNYMIVFANGESYLALNFPLLPNLQNLILQRDLQIVLKNQQLFQKEDLHKWNQNKY